MFDLAALSSALAAHGRVARVVIAAHDGSSPREVGAAMLVWETGQSGTIGGGALEFEAVLRAREVLEASPPTLSLPHVGRRGPVAPVVEDRLPVSHLPPPLWGKDGVGGLASTGSHWGHPSASAAVER